MKQLFLMLIVFVFLGQIHAKESTAWGKKGHRVVASIADNYLKASTKRKLKKLLHHESLAFVSTFADEIKADKRYDKYKTWHYINMPLDGTYATSEKNPNGDLVTGIAYCKEIITSKTSTDDDKAFYLKLLIHLIGDLHQPFHIGLKDDRGGNDFHVQWNFKDSNMHKVWDTQMIESYGMSFTELANNADYLSNDEIKAIGKGSVLDWVSETHQLTKTIYNSAKEGENLRNSYSYKYLHIARQQMQKAAIRLAVILNDIL
ncbi:S1/P1 nuclease [Psychroserpens sp. MEBiC05023]